jgi:isopentenyl diphosphate isomerase/L-lactate dehydrogenase-like FMN-dependent dehydrogenase
MALRLKYAGIDAPIAVERDLERSLDAAVADRDGGAPLYALPTYTALLELRDMLADRGLAEPWAG